jgi:Flp pilus assembly pilin Flp
MQRFIQETRDAQAWRGPQTRRSPDGANIVEYGLLAMLVAILVATGATLMGNQLSGVFSTVANAMEQSAKPANRPQNVVTFTQRTNRKGAPIEREVHGKLSALTASPPLEEPLLATNER